MSQVSRPQIFCVQDVLGAVQDDEQAAVFLLRQLAASPATPGKPPHPGRTGKLSNPNTPTATSGSDVASGEGEQPVDVYRKHR